MQQKTIIFIGASGAGKGTQSKAIETYLSKHDSERKIVHIEAGARFRDFIKGKTYTHQLSHDVYLDNDRQPDFLAILMWSQSFVDQIEGNEHVLIDGTPRSLNEAQVLDTAVSFYGWEKPYVIYLNVSHDVAKERLLSRERFDDTEESVDKRLEWFNKSVLPAIDYYRDNPNYHFLEVSGEKDIEDVQRAIRDTVFNE